MNNMNRKRPKFLALYLIKQPLPAVVSILHRISGLLLFLALPWLLLMLQYSLHSRATYLKLYDIFALPLSKLLVLALVWAFLHHLCAGVRFLVTDLHFVRTRARARFSSGLVLVTSLGLTALIGGRLW